MTEQTQPTDAEILDAADDFRSQYKHGGTTFDEFDALGFARAVLAKWGTPAGAEGDRMADSTRRMIEGMSVSIDVSTGDHDAGRRYFGTVTEVMDCNGDKHGVTLLVQDAEPNFTPHPTQAHIEKCAVCGDGNARLLVMRNCDVCGSDYAGQSESEVNVALERARRATQAQAGAVPVDRRPFPAFVDGLLWLCAKESDGTIKPIDGASALPIPRSWKTAMLSNWAEQGADHVS